MKNLNDVYCVHTIIDYISTYVTNIYTLLQLNTIQWRCLGKIYAEEQNIDIPSTMVYLSDIKNSMFDMSNYISETSISSKYFW